MLLLIKFLKLSRYVLHCINVCVFLFFLQVRVNCLVCMGKILEHLDRWLVMDDVFPFLETVPSREAPVIMAIVGELWLKELVRVC